MTAHALVTGTIFRDPGQCSSKSGNAFVSATVKVRDGDAAQWWKALSFGTDAQAELMRLGDGEAVSVQGVRHLYAGRQRAEGFASPIASPMRNIGAFMPS
jgi:hypothetical protein